MAPVGTSNTLNLKIYLAADLSRAASFLVVGVDGEQDE
jgi:hypothetical protein